MGGHAAGEVASAMAIETIASLATGDVMSVEQLTEAVRRANLAINDRAAIEPEKHGMGTTLTVLTLSRTGLSYRIAHVGDSRAYLFRDDRLQQLTHDHTWVQLQVDAGLMSPQQARRHPRSNVITRSLGFDPAVEPDLETGDLRAGDLLLLCSDGLTGMLEDAEIAALMSTHADLHHLAGGLIDAANLHGGTDNITLLLIRISA